MLFGRSTSFSEFTQIYSTEPLPLTLIAFDGVGLNNAVRLNWTTTNELNFSHFVVERKQTGGDFKPLGKVSSTGGGAYKFFDKKPENGYNYYRLRMVENNRSETFSKVIGILFEPTDNDKTYFYPNPLTEGNLYFNCDLPDNREYKASIQNVLGQTLWQSSLNCSDKNVIAWPKNLSNAVYFVKIEGNGLNQTYKIQILNW